MGTQKKLWDKLKKNKVEILFIVPALLVLGGLVLYPLINSFGLSFYSYNLAKPYLGQVFVGLANYWEMLKDSSFWNAVGVTIYFTGSSITLQLLIGLGVSLLLSDGTRIKKAIIPIFIAPMLVSPIVVGLLWRWMYNPEVGIIGYFCNLVGIDTPNWLGSLSLALPSVVLAETWHFTPYVILILSAALRSIPERLYDAAKIDGASRWQIFRSVTLPLLKPVLLVVLLMRTMGLVKTFDKIFTLTGGGPSEATEALSLLVYRNAFEFLEIGYASASSYAMVFIMIIISLVYIRILYVTIEI